MNEHDAARRRFLSKAGAFTGSAWLSAQLPAIAAAAEHAAAAFAGKAGFRALSMDEATTLDALAAHIVPTDDTPGAREAGVIYFIDAALVGFQAGALDFVRSGLTELHAQVGTRYPGATHFLKLSAAQQIEYLHSIDKGPFFGLVRFLTLAGLFSSPVYHGNRDRIGWELIGFVPRHGWLPPFGYYDAEAAEDSADG